MAVIAAASVVVTGVRVQSAAVGERWKRHEEEGEGDRGRSDHGG